MTSHSKRGLAAIQVNQLADWHTVQLVLSEAVTLALHNSVWHGSSPADENS